MATRTRRRPVVLPPSSRGTRSWVQVPLGRRATALLGNSFRMVVLYGLRSWWRDIRIVSVAIGSLSLVLLLGGFLSLAGLGGAHPPAAEARGGGGARPHLAPGAAH